MRKLVAARRPAGPALASDIVWLFDLDNTLHDCSRHIFPAIDGAMTATIAEQLGLTLDQADNLRNQYWKRYGATAIGLERHHGMPAADFLDACHRFDVTPLVHSESGLASKLARLPGRRILLTNAPQEYARNVLRALGILHEFEMLWTIDHMRLQGRLRPKPSVAMLRQLLARLRVPASRVVLVDDTLKNLRSAHALGIGTVLSHHPGTPHNSRGHGRGSYVDMRVNSICQLLTSRQRRVGKRPV
ncbi:MAG: pyrimidine 5'-nucleotidase [Burkholderiaceae bacterium]